MATEWTVVRAINLEKQKVSNYFMETATGDLYLNEEWSLLATKCFLVFLFTPLYTFSAVLWNCSRTVKDLFFHQKKILQDIWDVVRPFFYGAGMMTALMLPVNLYRKRKYVAQLEKDWNRNVPFRKGAFYIAPCFQKRGHIADSRHRLVGQGG